MRYSLLRRFEGALLGSLIGNFWGNSSSTTASHQNARPFANQMLSLESEIGFLGCASLISRGKLNREKWLEEIHLKKDSLLKLKNSASSSETAIAILPAILFFHESPSLLRENLAIAASIWQSPDLDTAEAIAWGEAIALLLREKSDPRNLVKTILNNYLPTENSPLSQKLALVETLLTKKINLDRAVRELSGQSKSQDLAIPLALYCFCTTPEDFRLCVLRALQTGYAPAKVAALTGAIAGAYNSLSGIPLRWRLATKKHELGRKALQLAASLFAVWSGVYQLENTNEQLLTSAAVGAGGTIKPRPQLQIISQRE
ncbi:ADP-ribosylglycohydrolase family protein [Oscillatoria salina]|uniref:ADP-ribosylglycohydrolase family protein n=1 Tax=Oscillatoria salina TaxID=331517 RepID=UPI0013B9AF69|nr:ADP-ribosylglycohydrolase family protein [Oscillatoria salina]MBZ8182760.1 ADP-ribosylglycohydrolase family protein [Oscillatoria salina IIICB1]NET89435.1 ADP-ribosylglycohydrolase family protein [Kamptonema sp. SIO1D9]